ncbi:hypothetical protein [Rhizobium sp.]
MKQTIFLHVGTHKTGTTAIQAYLHDHSKQLKARGVFFIQPRVTKGRGEEKEKISNPTLFAHHFLRPELLTSTMWRARKGGERFRERVEECTDWISDRLDSKRGTNHLLSTEALCYLRTEEEFQRVSKYFDELDYKVQPIIVFRNEKDWRESFDAQMAKSNYKDCYAVEPDPMRRVDSDWYYDTKSIVDFWSRFAEPAIISYDDEMEKRGTIIPSLIEAIGLDVATLETGPSLDKYFRNRRKTPAA